MQLDIKILMKQLLEGLAYLHQVRVCPCSGAYCLLIDLLLRITLYIETLRVRVVSEENLAVMVLWLTIPACASCGSNIDVRYSGQPAHQQSR